MQVHGDPIQQSACLKKIVNIGRYPIFYQPQQIKVLNMPLKIYADPESLSKAAAELFATKARQSVTDHDRFCVALSGGLTPMRTFEILAQKQWQKKTPWNKTHVFWSDERYVSENNVLRNSLMARQSMLDHVPIPAKQIHTFDCNLSPEKCAEQYDHLLHSYFSQHLYFDLLMLGLGAEGHAASIFQGSTAIGEHERWVTSVNLPGHDLQRITLTLPIINRSACILFLVAGVEKAKILKEVIEPKHGKLSLPAHLVCPINKHAEIYWMIDKAAASQLRNVVLAHSN
jgi:6-phosphogluconolactonase